MMKLANRITLVLGVSAILWLALEKWVIVQPDDLKPLKKRYQLIYGVPESQDMQAVQNFILMGKNVSQALQVDILKELSAPTKHID